jgi:hypothetical protein
MVDIPSIDTSERLGQGTRLKFVDGNWDAEGRDMTGQRLLTLRLTRGLRRWSDETLEEISEDAGPLPNHNDMNAAIPQAQWRIGLNGEPEPPWQMAYAVYLLDTNTFELFNSINQTFGQRIAWEKLREQVRWCSAVRKTSMHPMVVLGSARMKTKMAKLRPDFAVVAGEWMCLAAEATAPLLTHAPATPALLQPAAEPTAKEALDDEIPF